MLIEQPQALSGKHSATVMVSLLREPLKQQAAFVAWVPVKTSQPVPKRQEPWASQPEPIAGPSPNRARSLPERESLRHFASPQASGEQHADDS